MNRNQFVQNVRRYFSCSSRYDYNLERTVLWGKFGLLFPPLFETVPTSLDWLSGGEIAGKYPVPQKLLHVNHLLTLTKYITQINRNKITQRNKILTEAWRHKVLLTYRRCRDIQQNEYWVGMEPHVWSISLSQLHSFLRQSNSYRFHKRCDSK